MDEERKQILDMLAAGKISVEDAERLMDKLEAGARAAREDTPSPSPSAEPFARLKYLRVLVDGGDGDKVNIRVPLALIRTGVKLAAVLPTGVSEQLDEKGVDLGKLSELDADELADALRDLSVDVDADGGEKIRVFCE
jgi:hypothetical protein